MSFYALIVVYPVYTDLLVFVKCCYKFYVCV